MSFPRFLSFAVPAAIIVFAILGHAVTSAAQRGCMPRIQGGNTRFFVTFGIGLGVALLVLAATIYGSKI